MVALGLSVGTAVRVGQAAGAGDAGEARFAGIAGLAMAMGVVGLVGLGLLAFAPTVVGFYSADPALIARAAPIIAILAVSMVFDAGQVVLGQATRALGDSWVTTGAFFAAFFGVMVPLGLVLAFRTPLAEVGPLHRHGARLRHRRGAAARPLPPARRPAAMSAGSIRSYLAWLPQAALLALARALPYRARLALGSAFLRTAVAVVPNLRGRVDNNLKLIFPEMPPEERARIRRAMADNFGRTLIETVTVPQFQARAAWSEPSGPGWEPFLAARAAGRGALLVSGHFGQWEAVRGMLKARGIEAGALYRPVKNPWLQAAYFEQMSLSGAPLVPAQPPGHARARPAPEVRRRRLRAARPVRPGRHRHRLPRPPGPDRPRDRRARGRASTCR